MTTVTVDAVTRSKLRGLAEVMLFADESGRVLGHFMPVSEAGRREPRISDEEALRRLDEGGGRSLAEILADLEKQA
jgi:hypothetical protein